MPRKTQVVKLVAVKVKSSELEESVELCITKAPLPVSVKLPGELRVYLEFHMRKSEWREDSFAQDVSHNKFILCEFFIQYMKKL